MVTIDHKLSLYSKILHRSAEEKFAKEMEKLRKEYEVKIQRNKETVDKEAQDIIDTSRKKAEAEKIKLLSISRYNIKKETMLAKQRIFEVFTVRLREEIEKFILSEKYAGYLATLVKELMEILSDTKSVIIYLTDRDHVKYAETIRMQLVDTQITDIKFEKAADSLIGGFIAEDPVNNIRVDLSIKTLLEENESYIMQTLFNAIEAGEADETK